MRVSERLAVVALACAALAAAPPAFAQGNFREAYARGKEAAANSRWSEVEARMREAIAAEPTPQARVRIYGMRFEPYVPQYFLGLAAYRQGNCAEAQRQWSHAPTAAILQGDATLQGVVEQGLADCRRRQPQLAQQAPAQATPPSAQPPAAATPAPAPVAQREAPTARPPAPPAGEPARPVATAPRPATPAQAAPAPAAASTAPPALVSALEAFIAGRTDAAANLDLAPFTDPRARYHALLLRSAARHALSQAGGERSEALLAGAQADIRAARALLPAQAPDAALFSPRYRRLFDATR